MKHLNTLTAASALAISLSLGQGPAYAQAQSAGSGPAAEPAGLGDIIITAQRREERLQDVPVAVSAFNAATLENAGVVSGLSLSNVTPSLNLPTSASGVTPILRGIGNPTTTPGNEPSTALYVDGVYYSRLPNSTFNFNNIERVEVLRGPQGTLFGRNAVGGLIHIITRNPSFEPAARVQLGYANYETLSGNFYGTMGLTESIAADLAITASHQDEGWGRNIYSNDPYGYENSVNVRTKFLFDLGADTQIIFSANYQNTQTTVGFPVGVYEGTRMGAPPAGAVEVPRIGFYDAQNGGGNVGKNNGYGASLQIDHSFGFADFLSLTAYTQSREHNLFDFDYTPANHFLLTFDVDPRTVSQEFRLQSPSGSTYNWVAGLYYSDNFVLAGPTTFQGAQFPFARRVQRVEQTTESLAAFGQVTAPLSSATNLTVGVRYTQDDLDYSGTQTDTAFSNVVTITSAEKTTSFERTNFRVNLDHNFTDDVMGYATFSTGYKAGTFNVAAVNLSPAGRPETVESWELGLKTQLFDGRLRLNGAIYNNEITDPQVQIRQGIAFILINAEGARTRGLELEGEALLTSDLTLRFSAGWLDAEYTSFLNAPGVRQNVTQPPYGNGAFFSFNAAGFALPRAPDFTGSIGLTYDLDTSAGAVQISGNYAYNDGYFWYVDNQIAQDAYSLLDAQVSFTPASNDAWRFRLWGRNLTDTAYYAYAAESNGQSAFAGAPAAPMTYGMTVEYNF